MNEILDYLSTLAETVGFVGPYLPVVTRAVISYYVNGPVLSSWDLKFHVVFTVAKYFLYCNNTYDRLSQMKTLTQKPSFTVSSKAVVKEDTCPRRREGVEFIMKHCIHIPVAARDIESKISGEWVSSYENVDSERVVLWFHGGAYVFGSPQLERNITYIFSKEGKAKVYGVAYRLSPKYEFPCALIDAISGYLYLLENYDPKNIMVGGESAGGGLTVSLLLAIREMQLPFPAGAILLSPWVDLTHKFPSFTENKDTDILPSKAKFLYEDRRHAYAPNEILDYQFVSPLWAESYNQLIQAQWPKFTNINSSGRC
jgi:acetyl esterase/lipase